MYRISQFSDPLHIHPLAMLFGTVNSHEQVCDQAGKDLDHNSISASRNEMVNVETLFPCRDIGDVANLCKLVLVYVRYVV